MLYYPEATPIDPMPQPPVGPQEAAAWAKVDDCDGEEGLMLAAVLEAAMLWAESVDGAGQPLFDRRYQTVLPYFYNGRFDAFFTTAVESVAYRLPGESSLQTLAPSAYRFEDGALTFGPEAHALGIPERVVITHRCGFPAAELGADIKKELLRYVAWNYQHRGDEKPQELVWTVNRVYRKA